MMSREEKVRQIREAEAKGDWDQALKIAYQDKISRLMNNPPEAEDCHREARELFEEARCDDPKRI